MKYRPFILLLLVLALPGTLLAQDPDQDYIHNIYKKVRPSVVGIRCQTMITGTNIGTGIILDDSGLVLTSSAVVPNNPPLLQVFLEGPVMVSAEYIGNSQDEELALIRLTNLPEGYKLTPIEMGTSNDVHVGQQVFTFGNATFSIIFDDKAVMHSGIISGVYDLKVKRRSSHYTGRTFETTASIYPATTDGKGQGMAGGPMVDTKGRLIALNIANFDHHRWLSNAVPIDFLKPVIGDILEAEKKEAELDEPPPAGPGWIGIRFDAAASKEGHLVVASVDEGSPAEDEGIEPGDVVVSLGDNPVPNAETFISTIRDLTPGSLVYLGIKLGGEGDAFEVKLPALALPKDKE